MSDAPITVSPKKVNIHIELHRNGVTVSAHVPRKKDDEMGEELSYVYKTINEMIKELPSFISVLKEKMGLNSDNPTKNEPDFGNSKEEEELK